MRGNYSTYPVVVNGRTHHTVVQHGVQAVHEGTHYTVLEWRALDEDDVFDLFMQIPPRFRAHFNYEITTNKSTQMQVYKNTLVTGGTAIQGRNRNFEVGGSLVDLILDGTVDTIGDLIADITWGTVGGPGNRSPSEGGADSSNPFLLPENFTLRFRLTSKDDTNNVIVRMNFLMEPMIPQE